MSTNPIGVFDSGLGGLVVVKAMLELLPNENIIYVGDTAHSPWGDKSKTALNHFAQKIFEFLTQQNCKAILIACNTASSVTLNHLLTINQKAIPILDVITPAVAYIKENFNHAKLGLIATKQTINSKNYQTKIAALNQAIEVLPLATPLLVPLIEEGWLEKLATKLILHDYLNNFSATQLDALILGCTHFPLLENLINDYYNNKVKIINSATIAAHATHKLLKNINKLNTHESVGATAHQIFVTDYSDFLVKIVHNLLPNNINLQYLPLWE